MSQISYCSDKKNLQRGNVGGDMSPLSPFPTHLPSVGSLERNLKTSYFAAAF